MKTLAQLILTLFAFNSVTANAQTINETEVQHTELTQLARQWGITIDDAQKYSRYMSTAGKYFYSHLDPVMVLGFISEQPKERSRLAEIYLRESRKRYLAEKQFVNDIGHAQKRMFGPEKLYDLSTLPNYASRNLTATNQAYKAPKQKEPSRISSPRSIAFANHKGLMSIDIYIDNTCTCEQRLAALLTTPTDVILNLYVEATPTDNILTDIETFKEAASISRVITTKIFDPIVWGKHDTKLAIFRENAIAIALF